jgi:chemotaxis signal transduction protein
MASPGFAVATATRSHILPLDAIVQLSDTLALGPAPEPNPAIAGLALYHDEMLPVISLDVLLGESEPGERGWEDREWGGFAVVAAAGRRCVLAVDKIGILVRDAYPGTMLELGPLLAALLPEVEAPAPPPPAPDLGWTRYLLTEVGGQFCGFRLDAVDRVQDECRIIRAPHRAGSVVAGIGTVEGRVLPVLDARALLGFPATRPAGGFVVTAGSGAEHLIVAVDRVLGLRRIDEAALEPPPENSRIGAVGSSDGKAVWLLTAAGLAGAP